MFCFHHDYSISFTKNIDKKLFQQYVDLFKVVQKVENLVYKLTIFDHWQIHFVFIIVQFESVPNFDSNSYEQKKGRLFSIIVNEDIDAVKNYIVKKIIRTRQIVRDKICLIRWKKYGPENDVWRNLLEMNNVFDLVREFENKNVISDTVSLRIKKRSKKNVDSKTFNATIKNETTWSIQKNKLMSKRRKRCSFFSWWTNCHKRSSLHK